MRHAGSMFAACLMLAWLVPAPVAAAGGDEPGADRGAPSAEVSMEEYQRAFQPSLERAESLLGAEVVDSRGHGLGEIEDLILNPEMTGVRYVLVAFEGSAGEGGGHPVPWSLFTFQDVAGRERPRVVLDATRKELGEFTAAVDEVRDDLLVSSLIGRHVGTARDQDLGGVCDLVVDTNRGHVAYAVVSVDAEGLGLESEERVAIPWPSIETGQDPMRVTFAADRLAQMRFQPQDLERLEDRDVAQRQHQFAQSAPYWTASYWADLEQEARREQPIRYGSQNGSMMVEGTVQRVLTRDVDGRTRIRLEVITANGVPYTVDAGAVGGRGPGHRFRVNTVTSGDRVRVTGVQQVEGGGKAVVLARSIVTGGREYAIERGEGESAEPQEKTKRY